MAAAASSGSEGPVSAGDLPEACPGCAQVLASEHRRPHHAGFANEGFLYCDRDDTVVTFSTFDETYTRIVGDRHPWGLDRAQRDRVEARVLPCPCGGRFKFQNALRCTKCGHKLSGGIGETIYWYGLARVVEVGPGASIWRPGHTA